VIPSSARQKTLRIPLFALALTAVLLPVGCGPILSTTTLQDAERALQDARAAEAEDLAVYEFVSAEAYFDKAREEWGYSDFRAAREYAARAVEFARLARERAVASPRRGMLPALEVPDVP
jgi:hypothetical protein